MAIEIKEYIGDGNMKKVSDSRVQKKKKKKKDKQEKGDKQN